jgi:hypothetical protein
MLQKKGLKASFRTGSIPAEAGTRYLTKATNVTINSDYFPV